MTSHPKSTKSQFAANTNSLRAFEYVLLGKDEFRNPYTVERRRFSVKAIGAIGVAAKSAAPTLIRLLDSKSPPDVAVWPEAAAALHRMGVTAEEYAPVLRNRLEDTAEQINVRVAAAQTLAAAKSKDPITLASLRDQLQDTSSHVRVAAARALYALEAPPDELLAVLVPLLNHKLASIRTATLTALAEMGGAAHATRPAIQELLADPSESVRAAAGTALEKIPKPSTKASTEKITSAPSALVSNQEIPPFIATGFLTHSDSSSKTGFWFSYSNGWWQVELSNASPSHGGPTVQNCRRIPDGVRHYMRFQNSPHGLTPATACPSAFPPPGMAGGMFECWLSLCPYPELPLIDDRRLHRFLNVPTCQSELYNDPRSEGDYHLVFQQPQAAFIRELIVTNSGFWVDLSPQAEFVFVRHGQPFDNGGFPERKYTLLESTNLHGFTFPLRGRFEYWMPSFPATTRDEIRQARSLNLTVTEIRLSPENAGGSKSPVPILFGMDYRPSDYTSSVNKPDRFLGTRVTNDHWVAVVPSNRTLRILPTAEDLGSQWSRQVGFLFNYSSSREEDAPRSLGVPEPAVERIRASAMEQWEDPVLAWAQAHFHVRADGVSRRYEVQAQRYESRGRLRTQFAELLDGVRSGLGERRPITGIGESAMLYASSVSQRMTIWFFARDHLVWVTPLGPGPHRSWESDEPLRQLAETIALKLDE
jgi:hypothetical protein